MIRIGLVPSLPVQERLLLSLLPAHIARVMKAEIIQRLQGPNFGRTESTNNFHNLYVQRHTNVRYGSRFLHLLPPHIIKVMILCSHLGGLIAPSCPPFPPSSSLPLFSRHLVSDSSLPAVKFGFLVFYYFFFFLHPFARSCFRSYLFLSGHLLSCSYLTSFHRHGEVQLKFSPSRSPVLL